jgi:hypothetical protein
MSEGRTFGYRRKAGANHTLRMAYFIPKEGMSGTAQHPVC